MMLPDDSDALQLQPDPDKLDRYHRQQLSAMLDGELSPDQARFMLRRLEHDTELAGCWERWQVCGDVLRGRHEAPLPADFAAGIALAINAGARLPGEVAAPAAAAPMRRGGMLRWGGGAALAASVAMAAFFVGRQAPPADAGTQPQVAAAVDTAPQTTAPAVVAESASDGIDASTVALASAAAAAVEAPPRRVRPVPGPAADSRTGSARQPVQVAAAAPPLPPADVGFMMAAEGTPLAAGIDGIDAGRVLASGDARVARPWPRAGAGAPSPFAAGTGGVDALPRSFHPFEPQIDARVLPRPSLVWPAPVLDAGLPGLRTGFDDAARAE